MLSKYEEIELVYEFFKSDEITEEEADKEFEKFINLIEDLELKNMLRNEEDSFDAILTINSGLEALKATTGLDFGKNVFTLG